jgi:hypothetical protein
MRRAIYITIIFLLLVPILAGFVGNAIGPGALHPARLNPERFAARSGNVSANKS